MMVKGCGLHARRLSRASLLAALVVLGAGTVHDTALAACSVPVFEEANYSAGYFFNVMRDPNLVDFRQAPFARGANPSPLQVAQRVPDERDRGRQIPHDDLSLNAKHLTPEPAQVAVAASVSRDAPPMLPAIHLDDKPHRGGEEIRDSAAEHDLPPKANAKLPSRKLQPEPALRLRRADPILLRIGSEDVPTSGAVGVKALEHGDLLAPGTCPGAAFLAQAS